MNRSDTQNEVDLLRRCPLYKHSRCGQHSRRKSRPLDNNLEFQEFRNISEEDVVYKMLEEVLQQGKEEEDGRQKKVIRMKVIELFLYGQVHLKWVTLEYLLKNKLVIHIERATVKKGVGYVWKCINDFFGQAANTLGLHHREQVVVVFSAVDEMRLEALSTLIKKLAEVNQSKFEVIVVLVEVMGLDCVLGGRRIRDSSVLCLLKLFRIVVPSLTQCLQHLFVTSNSFYQICQASLSQWLALFTLFAFDTLQLHDLFSIYYYKHNLTLSLPLAPHPTKHSSTCFYIQTILFVSTIAISLGIKKANFSLLQLWSGKLPKQDLIYLLYELGNVQDYKEIMRKLGSVLFMDQNMEMFIKSIQDKMCLQGKKKEVRCGKYLASMLMWLFENYYLKGDQGVLLYDDIYVQSITDSSVQVEIHNCLYDNIVIEGEDLCRGYQLIQNKGVNIEIHQWKQDFQDLQGCKIGFNDMIGGLKFMGWVKESNRCKEKNVQLVVLLEG